MKTKVIVLAVSSVLAMPMMAVAADGSDVKLYGRVAVEYGSVRINQAASASDYRQESLSDNGGVSRWGLLIKEDLGNGLSANARIEYGFRTGNGVADNVREQWVGLASKSWGEVKFGRVQSPLKDFAGGLSIDPFGDTNLQAVGTGGVMYGPNNGLGAGGFVDHSLRYNSPEFSGFSGSLLYVPSDATQAEPSATGGGGTGGKGGANDYQLALKYKVPKFGEVFVAYSKDNASDSQVATVANGRNGDDESVWRLGGAVDLGDFRLAGQYEHISNALENGGAVCGGGASLNGGGDAGLSTSQCNSALNANGDGHLWFLTGQYKFGKTTLVLQGGKSTADAVSNAAGVLQANERTAKNVTLAAIYKFSKRTSVYGGYQKVSVEGARNVANTTVKGTTVLAIQPDRSTWSIGMRHDF